MSIKLSEGSLESIMTGGQIEGPVMQILSSKKIQGSGSNERYRLLVSDGKHTHSFAMLATQLNPMLTSGELSDFTVVKVDRYITSLLNNTGGGEKRVMIILALTVIASGTSIGMKIGNPSTWQEGANVASSNPPAATNGASSAPSFTRQPAPQPRPTPATNGPHGGQLAGHMTHPIAGLSPYQNKWVIKARVMNKSNIRTWSNSKGEGKLFSMDLCDESGEIRATAFKEQCDKYYDMIEVDKAYYISRCTLKTANKQYSTLKNDYEMTFTNDTVVEECTEDMSVPAVQYNFVPICEIANKEADAIVDLIGVCKDSSDVVELTSRAGRQLKKREVSIVDQSGSAVSLTLWGDDAVKFDGSQKPVVAVRSAVVAEYAGGKSISMRSSSNIRLNPDIPEAHRLRGWYDNGGSQQDITNMSARTGGGGVGSSDWLTFSDVEERQLGSSEKGDYYNLLGILSYVNSENALYKACPQEQCNKKLVDQENGLYRCEKCNREYPNYKYRIIMSGTVCDYTGEQWVTIFNETAETIIGRKVEEIGQALETDKKLYASMFEDVKFKSFLFRIRTKMENYSDESRLKSTVMNVHPIDYKDANMKLIKQIKEASGIELH